MSNAVFPSLPGEKIGISRTAGFKTKTQESVSGNEARAAFRLYPLWQIGVSYEVLTDGYRGNDLQTLEGFFLQMRGSWDSFLLSVPSDNAVVDMAFGVGDGTKKVFQLTRSRGAGGFAMVEPCQNIASLTNIKIAGTATSAYSIGSTGLVTFVTAPANGAALTWSGSFYYRCRFLDDELEVQRVMAELWDGGDLKMKGAPGNKV